VEEGAAPSDGAADRGGVEVRGRSPAVVPRLAASLGWEEQLGHPPDGVEARAQCERGREVG